MNFSIDYGTIAVSGGQAPLYASEDGIAHGLGNEECLFQVRRTGEVHPMTTQVLSALDRCRTFRTLDEHARTIAQAMPALRDKGDAVRRVLEGLVQRGLMVEAGAWLAAMRTPVARPRGGLRHVVVRACDRPRELRALLDTLQATEGAAARSFVVLDDSRDEAASRGNAEAIAAARAAGLRVEHVGGARWRASGEALARALPAAAEAARLALSREQPLRGGGKGMNLALLLGAGAAHGLLDEDFRFPLRRHPAAQDAVSLIGGADLPVRFYADVDAALADGRPVEGDPFAWSEAWCGETLGAALAREAPVPAASLRDLAPSRVPFVAPGRIAAVCHGHRGSAGTATAEWMFLLDPESREPFWRDRDAYLRHLEARAVWFGPRRARVLAHGHFTPFAVDGSVLAPPTRAGGRSEDLLFGLLTRLADPDAVVWHTQATIGHRQEAERDRAASLRRADTPGLNTFLVDLLGSREADLRAESPASRLATSAAWLRDLAGASRARRIETLAEYLRFRRADLVRRLQEIQAAAKDAPVHWLADARELVTVNGRALMANDPPRLGDAPADADAAQLADHFARELSDFATVLEGWPALWAHAAEREGRILAPA